MARLTRDARLESRDGRARLKARHAPYWRTIHRGLAIGYRKGTRGGMWMVRRWDGQAHIKQVLGVADDRADADGKWVLDYSQAHRQALEFTGSASARKLGMDPTVEEVMRYYLQDQQHSKSYRESERTINAHIIPAFDKRRVSSLTTAELRQWHQDLAKQAPRRRGQDPQALDEKADAETIRRRQVTANRILTTLKAALNHAWRDEQLPHAELWRRVKPFKGVEQARIRFLSEAEATRLINACAADFRALVRAGLLTGARYGELTRMRARDFDEAAGTVAIMVTKGGRARFVPLTEEGKALFTELTAGKRAGDLIFTRSTGEPWGPSHQCRRMREACAAAKIDPPIHFHILRHSYASALARKGVPLQVIAEVLGHADARMTHRHYAHLCPNQVSALIRQHLPAFGEAESTKVTELKPGEAAGAR